MGLCVGEEQLKASEQRGETTGCAAMAKLETNRGISDALLPVKRSQNRCRSLRPDWLTSADLRG